ncbi:MAG: hypothetical protein R2856_23895 [Caldilineaceae bacterium]
MSKSAIYSGNLSWPELPIFLVEGVTNTGITAVGETDRGTSQATLEATLHDLLGRDLLAATPATMWMSESDAVGLPSRYPYWSWEVRGERSYLLMESLWLDAVGKATSLPAHAAGRRSAQSGPHRLLGEPAFGGGDGEVDRRSPGARPARHQDEVRRQR